VVVAVKARAGVIPVTMFGSAAGMKRSSTSPRAARVVGAMTARGGGGPNRSSMSL
jgi:hypothetical protein